MTRKLAQRLDTVDPTTLTPLVQRMLNTSHAEVTSWRYEPVEGGFGHAYGIYRFQGGAQAEGRPLGWSLILKILGPATGSQEPAALDYWEREALVYRTGLLDDLPGGLAAPRCMEVVEHQGGELWMWLEDVAQSGGKVWSLERYGLAARHLAQFNGAYLVGKPIPEAPWLLTDHLRRRLALAEPGIAALPQLSQHPLFEVLLPGDSLERSLRLFEERHRLLAFLDRLPRTLCHHDAFRRNLIARTLHDGRAQTVAIDWAALGPGGPGEEIAPLFSGSLKFVAFDLDKLADLDAVIFAGYVDGLRDAGWQGDPRLVRLGYAATAALTGIADRGIKWRSVARRVAALPAGAELPRLLNPGGWAQTSATHLYPLGLGDEALTIAGS